LSFASQACAGEAAFEGLNAVELSLGFFCLTRVWFRLFYVFKVCLKLLAVEYFLSLQSVKIKPVYYSDDDNLLEEFYVPVLSKAIKYDRIAGYFSSNTLAIAARGIGKSPIEKTGWGLMVHPHRLTYLYEQQAVTCRVMWENEDVGCRQISLLHWKQ
jgi:hypothetical protein